MELEISKLGKSRAAASGKEQFFQSLFFHYVSQLEKEEVDHLKAYK